MKIYPDDIDPLPRLGPLVRPQLPAPVPDLVAEFEERPRELLGYRAAAAIVVTLKAREQILWAAPRMTLLDYLRCPPADRNLGSLSYHYTYRKA